jgi:hypothetical protein
MQSSPDGGQPKRADSRRAGETQTVETSLAIAISHSLQTIAAIDSDRNQPPIPNEASQAFR